jgi:hypothetical protein
MSDPAIMNMGLTHRVKTRMSQFMPEARIKKLAIWSPAIYS